MDENKKINRDDTNETKDNNSDTSDENNKNPGKKNELVLSKSNKNVIIRVPIIPLKDTVIFPHTLSTLVIDNEKMIEFINTISNKDGLIALFPSLSDKKIHEQENNILTISKNKSKSKKKIYNLQDKFEFIGLNNKKISNIGVICRIVKHLRFPDNTLRMLVRGLARVKILNILSATPHITATVEKMEDLKSDNLECAAMAKNAQRQFQEIINASQNFPEELKIAVLNINDYSKLSDIIADTININFIEKLQLLTITVLSEKLQLLTILLNREVEVLHLGNEIQNQVSNALSQSQREFFLREQLKAIKKELGHEDLNPDIVSIYKKLKKKNLSDSVLNATKREIEKLEMMPASSAEYHVSYNYIDWILSLPWNEYTEDRIDIEEAKKILDQDHFDLKDIKERILELIAVLQLKKDRKAPIQCFIGPPGVGKTSLGKSIAKALNRKFVRVSLGGIRDEAEIRGHRRTYIGALPGRIIQGIKKAGSSNPVFMLDEIDKIGNDFRGDTSASLLEILDPQQNNSFSDHFLELDYDLSSVMFIATANILDTIPDALLDRMEILKLSGYTVMEKIEIAKKFLTPRQIEENGLQKNKIKIHSSALKEIIEYYTREAGVRNLERTIGNVLRKVSKQLVEGKINKNMLIIIKKDNINTYLGKRKFIIEEAERKPEIGIAVGMAWTNSGGVILPVESTMMPGKGILKLTGSLGDIMKESGQAAFSYIQSNYKKLGIDKKIFEKNDFHIHVPDGATPKDGPSAGITLIISMISLLTKRKTKIKTAMTGEINLRGKITGVGGIKEKMIGAFCAGIRTIIIPKQNEKDLEDIPEEIKNKLKIILADNIKNVIDETLL
jgi:ATP-dependent Lon protease